MKREDFIRLPTSIALSLLWDQFPAMAKALEGALVPKIPTSPKFDSAIYRKEGIQWASESDLESLRYWHQRYAEGAAKGGEYAENDAKRAKAMEFWIAWRLVEPHAQWTGERNREKGIVAAPPCAKPTLHAKPPKNGETGTPAQSRRERKFEDEEPVDDDSIPY